VNCFLIPLQTLSWLQAVRRTVEIVPRLAAKGTGAKRQFLQFILADVPCIRERGAHHGNDGALVIPYGYGNRRLGVHRFGAGTYAARRIVLQIASGYRLASFQSQPGHSLATRHPIDDTLYGIRYILRRPKTQAAAFTNVHGSGASSGVVQKI
jgi:hypothetical protein